MDKKLITGISLGLLFVAFGLVSFLVILTKRHPYFLAKKLRLGALIITVSGAAIGCRIGPTTCYATMAPESIVKVDQANSQNGMIEISRAITDTITGKIRTGQATEFSYAIVDSLDSIVVKDNISPVDGTFDEDTEEFKIGLGHAIMPGTYDLRFYATAKDSIQNIEWYEGSFPLTITE